MAAPWVPRARWEQAPRAAPVKRAGSHCWKAHYPLFSEAGKADLFPELRDSHLTAIMPILTKKTAEKPFWEQALQVPELRRGTAEKPSDLADLGVLFTEKMNRRELAPQSPKLTHLLFCARYTVNCTHSKVTTATPCRIWPLLQR